MNEKDYCKLSCAAIVLVIGVGVVAFSLLLVPGMSLLTWLFAL